MSISDVHHLLSPARLDCGQLLHEPAITGLDWSFATIPRSTEGIALHNPLGPPCTFRCTSTCPGIDQPASGSTPVTQALLTPRPLHCCCGLSLSLRVLSLPPYARHRNRLPGPCFETERATPVERLPSFLLSPAFTSGSRPFRAAHSL